jgi:hypothetical protein
MQEQPQLRGRFVLQLNEVVNIAAPARDRYVNIFGVTDVMQISIAFFLSDDFTSFLKL